jgi:hypothetical protein
MTAMPALMPADFTAYTVVASIAVGAAVASVIGATLSVRSWLRRRRRDVYAERQAYRDGYVGVGLPIVGDGSDLTPQEIQHLYGSTQALANVHPAGQCAGRPCCIHNPSDHPMRLFPQSWRGDRALMERVCPHGVGHPDPDDIAYKRERFGPEFANAEGIHGCDGCCTGNAAGAR